MSEAIEFGFLVGGEKTVPTGTAELVAAAGDYTGIRPSSVKGIMLVSDDGGDASNGNTKVVFVGPAGVTVSSGIPIRPGESLPLDANFTELHNSFVDPTKLYCIAISGGQKLRWAFYGGD